MVQYDAGFARELAEHMAGLAVEMAIEAYASRHPDAEHHDAHMFTRKMADHNAHVDTWWLAQCGLPTSPQAAPLDAPWLSWINGG